MEKKTQKRVTLDFKGKSFSDAKQTNLISYFNVYTYCM